MSDLIYNQIAQNSINIVSDMPSVGIHVPDTNVGELISRQDVIDFLQITRDSEYKKSMSAECKHKSVVRSKHDAHVAFCDYLIEYVKQVPTHITPSNTLGALDCISRQAAIDAINALHDKPNAWLDCAVEAVEELPSAQPQPEIIRCKDCGHYDGRPCGIVDWYNTEDDFCSKAYPREGDAE